MPTEQFNFHITTPVAQATFANTAGTMDAPGSPALDAIKECLVAGGWTIADQVAPFGDLHIYGLGITADPAVVIPPEERLPAGAGWIIRVGANSVAGSGTWVGGFNPYTQLPPAMPYYFAFGDDVPETAANIAGAIASTGNLTAYAYEQDGHSWVRVTAVTAGPATNNFMIAGDFRGEAIADAQLAGGGYVLRSGTYRGTQVELRLTEESPIGSSGGRLKFAFKVVGTTNVIAQPIATHNATGPPSFPAREYTLRMAANPYQFALWNSGPETGASAGSTSLLCSIPWRPDDTIGTCAIVIGSYNQAFDLAQGSLRNSLHYTVCFAALEGGFVELEQQSIGMALTRYPGEWGLKTTSGKPIIQTCYVGVRPQWADVDGQRVVGCLWSGALISDRYSMSDNVAEFSGYRWSHVGSQAGSYNQTQGSVWLASGAA